MKYNTFIAILFLATFTACGPTDSKHYLEPLPTEEYIECDDSTSIDTEAEEVYASEEYYTLSENIANCVEDYELTDEERKLSADLDADQYIEYVTDIASDYCDSIYQ